MCCPKDFNLLWSFLFVEIGVEVLLNTRLRVNTDGDSPRHGPRSDQLPVCKVSVFTNFPETGGRDPKKTRPRPALQLQTLVPVVRRMCLTQPVGAIGLFWQNSIPRIAVRLDTSAKSLTNGFTYVCDQSPP